MASFEAQQDTEFQKFQMQLEKCKMAGLVVRCFHIGPGTAEHLRKGTHIWEIESREEPETPNNRKERD